MKKFTMRKTVRGFSLIEIMVATFLLAMLGLLMMNSLRSSVNAKESIEEIATRYHLARLALSRMSREISMAYLSRNISPIDPVFVTQFVGTKNSLYFSAFGNVITQKDAVQSEQQVLGFFLKDDKNGGTSLMRSHHPNLNLDVTKDGRAEVLCPKVTKLEFQYYDEKFQRWDTAWTSDPKEIGKSSDMNEDGAQTARRVDGHKLLRLPSMVKISLTVKMSDSEEMTWVSATKIPMQQPMNLE